MATLTAERWTREMVEMLVDGDTWRTVWPIAGWRIV